MPIIIRVKYLVVHVASGLAGPVTFSALRFCNRLRYSNRAVIVAL